MAVGAYDNDPDNLFTLPSLPFMILQNLFFFGLTTSSLGPICCLVYGSSLLRVENNIHIECLLISLLPGLNSFFCRLGLIVSPLGEWTVRTQVVISCRS